MKTNMKYGLFPDVGGSMKKDMIVQIFSMLKCMWRDIQWKLWVESYFSDKNESQNIAGLTL